MIRIYFRFTGGIHILCFSFTEKEGEGLPLPHHQTTPEVGGTHKRPHTGTHVHPWDPCVICVTRDDTRSGHYPTTQILQEGIFMSRLTTRIDVSQGNILT